MSSPYLKKITVVFFLYLLYTVLYIYYLILLSFQKERYHFLVKELRWRGWWFAHSPGVSMWWSQGLNPGLFQIPLLTPSPGHAEQDTLLRLLEKCRDEPFGDIKTGLNWKVSASGLTLTTSVLGLGIDLHSLGSQSEEAIWPGRQPWRSLLLFQSPWATMSGVLVPIVC